MAIRSLVIALLVTGVLGYSFTFGLTDPNSFLKKIPDWLSVPMLLAGGFLYLLAAWWALKGFHEHKIAALTSLAFCIFGLAVYATVFSMEFGRGKASPGQYEYDFTRLDSTEKVLVAKIALDAGFDVKNVEFTEHWHVADSSSNFKVCVQKGHVTALNVSNYTIKSLALFNQFPNLGDLYLRNCGLTDVSDLQTKKLDRLDLSNNQMTDLKTLSGCPNVKWLFVAGNPLKSTEGIENFRNLVSVDIPVDQKY
ncbi:MAG: hypothetical protein ABIN80_26425 [Dyadobacter sp.]|uniref:leucine-rich repeat domain-containing protein n=1 Tax=Dyadobacter sp. TaxID=1914288 RepID=UPI003262F385